MRFHAMMQVRDEGDVIAECLGALLAWADAVHILDTGSTDDTWDIINDLAAREPRLRPWRRDPLYFTMFGAVKSWMFSEIRSSFEHADWIVLPDADEFLHVPPPEFVRTLRRGETRVYSRMYEFVLTQSDADRLSTPEACLAERSIPIQERRTRYSITPYPEFRMFRYRRTMNWTPDRNAPFSCGVLASARLPIRHYRARDPLQLARRCGLRRLMRQDSSRIGAHWDLDWRELVCPDSADLLTWTPDSPLEPPRGPDRRVGTLRRCLQTLSAGALADAFRPAYPSPRRPRPIPPEENIRIGEIMRRSLESRAPAELF